MFDDQETHYPVPGETPWERLRYLATSTETIYPVPPYVCMKCRRVIVPRKWALILHDLAEILGYFWLFGIWFWPSVGVAPAKACWIYRTIRTRSSMPGRRRRAWPICAFSCVCFP